MDERTKGVRLIVEGIQLEGRHGVYPEERERGNRFRIDVEMQPDVAAALSTDRVEDTIDYAEIVRIVEEINSQRQFNLIESFAAAISDGLLKRFPLVHDVLVRVRKLSPPGLGSTTCATAEVRMGRE